MSYLERCSAFDSFYVTLNENILVYTKQFRIFYIIRFLVLVNQFSRHAKESNPSGLPTPLDSSTQAKGFEKSLKIVTNRSNFFENLLVRFGFGLLDAWRLVNAALVWTSVPTLTSFSPLSIGFNEKIPMGAAYLRLPATVLERDVRSKQLNTLEHVQVTE